MNIHTLPFDTSSFLGKYLSGDYDALYDYNAMDFAARLQHQQQSAIGEVMARYMSDLDLSAKQRENLKFIQEGHMVVIGGQQAGLFVSPLYTIHKILSIIILAREQSEKLGSKIVPVFWIAGEDHDFDEVNHAYLYNDASLKKITAHITPAEAAVSRITLTDKEKAEVIHAFISHLHETQRTKEIYTLLESAPNDWTSLFKTIIHHIFKDEGLLLIDSDDAHLRKLESQHFAWMIEHHQAIDEAFASGQRHALEVIGTNEIVKTTNVNLFLDYEGKRQLLQFEEGKFTLSKCDVTFSKEELLNLAHTKPEIFSNNVVTRPLMQELVFNTLSFIAGPSEIKYWAELKEVFKLAGKKMPIITPRMQITYVPEQIERYLEKFSLQAANVIHHGTMQAKAKYLKHEENTELLDEIERAENTLTSTYDTLYKLAESSQVQAMVENNLKHQRMQFDYLRKAYNREINLRHSVQLKQLEAIELTLHPRDGLQERTWHPLQMINDYDVNFAQLTELNYFYGNTIVYL